MKVSSYCAIAESDVRKEIVDIQIIACQLKIPETQGMKNNVYGLYL